MSILSKYPSKYLKGDDIEVGETVFIKEVRDELVGTAQELKPVVYFNEYPKGVILNKTNARALVKVFGDDEMLWPGKRVVVTTVSARNPSTGEDTDAIRLAPAPEKKKAAKTTAEEINETPF